MILKVSYEKVSRRPLSQGMALVLQHHVRPIDVVHLIGVHRHQDTAYVCLTEGGREVRGGGAERERERKRERERRTGKHILECSKSAKERENKKEKTTNGENGNSETIRK